MDKHSRAEKERKAREKADKGGERRASSHELRTGKEGGGRVETKEKDMVRIAAMPTGHPGDRHCDYHLLLVIQGLHCQQYHDHHKIFFFL